MIIADAIFNHHAGSWLSVLSAWQLMVKAYGAAITGNIKYLHLWLQTFHCLIHFKYCVSRIIHLKGCHRIFILVSNWVLRVSSLWRLRRETFLRSLHQGKRGLSWSIRSSLSQKQTNKEHNQICWVFFFLVALFWFPVSPPFKFHTVSSHLFLSCVKISILCVLIQILYGITQA